MDPFQAGDPKGSSFQKANTEAAPNPKKVLVSVASDTNYVIVGYVDFQIMSLQSYTWLVFWQTAILKLQCDLFRLEKTSHGTFQNQNECLAIHHHTL